jgi:hypothetical protein
VGDGLPVRGPTHESGAVEFPVCSAVGLDTSAGIRSPIGYRNADRARDDTPDVSPVVSQ